MAKTYIIALIFLLSLTANSCYELPDNFTLPEWDVDLNIPITQQEYKLEDIIKRDKYIGYDSLNGGLAYILKSDTTYRQFSIEEFLDNQMDGSYSNFQAPLANGKAEAMLTLNNGARIDSAFIESGTLEASITNFADNVLDFKLTFPELLNSQGNSLIIYGSAEPNGKYILDQDLALFSYGNPDSGNNDKIRFVIEATGDFIADTISIEVAIKDTRLGYVEGVLPETKIDTMSGAFTLPLTDDVRKFRDKVYLGNVQFTLNGKYVSDYEEIFDVVLQNLKINGIRNDGNEIELKQAGNYIEDIYVDNGGFAKVFTSDNSNISEFLSFLPDSISITTGALFNPNMKSAIATILDSIRLSFHFSALGAIKLDTISFTDTLMFEISPEYRDEIRNAKSADIKFEFDNRIPIGSQLIAAFADSSFNLYFTKNFDVPGAEILTANASPSPVIIDHVITLDSTEIQQLATTGYILLDWKFSTTETQYEIIIRPEYTVGVKAYCGIRYTIKQ